MATGPLDDDLPPLSNSSAKMPSHTDGGSGSAQDSNYERLIARLINFIYEEIGQSQGIVERLPQVIQQAAQGRLQLFLNVSPAGIEMSSLSLDAPSIPVQIGGRFYGSLASVRDPVAPQNPPFPIEQVQLIARMCAIVMYVLEMLAFLRMHGPQSVRRKSRLTARRREVLDLMSRGYTDQTIAEALHIAPATVRSIREQIYKHFDVHTRHDAIIAAFLLGLYSCIEHLSPLVMGTSSGDSL